jgi:DinB superfamily
MSDEERRITDSDFAALLDLLGETPNKLARLTDGLSVADLRWKNSADEFSALENFCHLRDLELDGYTRRIKRILNEMDPLLADFDGARVAAEGNYNNQQPEVALETFQTARRKNVELLRQLTEQQLERGGTLEAVGKITLRQLAAMMREHDEGHIEDLRVLLQRLERRRLAAK